MGGDSFDVRESRSSRTTRRTDVRWRSAQPNVNEVGPNGALTR